MKKAKSPTKTQLAKALGVSRSTLYEWTESGCPTDQGIAAIQTWMATAGVGGDVGAPPDLKRQIAQKRLEILEQQRIAAVRENDKQSGLLMLVADGERQAAEAMAYTFQELGRIVNEAPPALAGLDAVSIFKILKGQVERMRITLTEKFKSIGQ